MKLRILIGVVLSVIFIYLSFWKVDLGGLFSGSISLGTALFGQSRINLDELGKVLASAHYGWLLLGVAMLLVSLFFRAERWRILLKPVHSQIHYWPVYSAMNIGYMINNILPLRMGEFLRAYFLGKAEGISKSSALATVVVERLLDMMAALVLLGISIFLFPFPDWIRDGLFYVGGAVVLLIGFLIALLVNTTWTLKLLGQCLFFLPHKLRDRIISVAASFTSGLEILRSAHHYLAILSYTGILIVCYLFSVFLTFLAFDLVSPQYPMIYLHPILASVVLLIIVTIGVGLPSAPGAVGTFHGIVALGVSLLGVPPEISMGVAITLHLANYIPLTALGLVCFWSQNFKFSEVKAQFPSGEGDHLQTH
ncbi:MAG: lysylphosphatidylglycerol synthase transmembrane domain-containing protein [bacterium]|nr:lysylphosphatidylglycerol synthase transmembrane domain-containing protein [bacterium]